MRAPHRRSKVGRPRGSNDMHRAARRIPPRRTLRYRASCVGPVIAGIRSSLGVSAEELAMRLGVTKWTVMHWESGRGVPPLHQLVAIAAALDCRVADLVVECDP